MGKRTRRERKAHQREQALATGDITALREIVEKAPLAGRPRDQARTMHGRALRALAKEGGEEATRAQVSTAAATLLVAIEARAPELMDRSDELSDALLDLI